MDKIVHGLDLPDEICEKNNRIMMEKLGVTEEEIESYPIEDLDDDE